MVHQTLLSLHNKVKRVLPTLQIATLRLKSSVLARVTKLGIWEWLSHAMCSVFNSSVCSVTNLLPVAWILGEPKQIGGKKLIGVGRLREILDN